MPDFQTNINIHETINSGQVFLWENYKNTWFGIDGYNVMKSHKDIKILRTNINFFTLLSPLTLVLIELVKFLKCLMPAFSDLYG